MKALVADVAIAGAVNLDILAADKNDLFTGVESRDMDEGENNRKCLVNYLYVQVEDGLDEWACYDIAVVKARHAPLTDLIRELYYVLAQ